MIYPYWQLDTNKYYSGACIPDAQTCIDSAAFKLKVNGIGRIKVRPDTAVVILQVITEDKQLKLAQQQNTIIMTAVLRSLKENGIPAEDIQTQSYNITPQYDYIEGKQVFRGYRVEHSLEVTITDMKEIGKIIDDAVQSGVNQVSSIKFSVANPSAYYQQALNAAVDNALEKARTLGNKLNVSVSQVPLQIVELGYETEAPIMPLTYQTVSSPTPIQTGLIEISARIEAVFSYKPMYS